MEYDDRFDPTMPNELDAEVMRPADKQKDALLSAMSVDRGMHFVKRKVKTATGETKQKKLKVYTSGGIGNRIRDAETGEYYPNMVGSKDEYLFYKVTDATGECYSPNGTSTLFFSSPHHYMEHLKSEINQEQIAAWEARRDARLKEIESMPKRGETVLVK